MAETHEERRQFERRQEEFLAARTGLCTILHMRLTPEGCKEIRNRDEPPIQCKYCPGVTLGERVVPERRSGKDRRQQVVIKSMRRW